MHREIMNPPDGFVVDHINHNTLDNQRNNLRVCTYSQNNSNKSRLSSRNKSGYRRVVWDKTRAKWFVSIAFNGITKTIGRFISKQDAIDAYKKANKEYYGAFGGVV